MTDTVRRSASWTRSGTPAEALGALKAYAQSHNGRAKENGSELTLRFGSRLGWRLMGTTAPRFLPYAVRISVASQGAESKLTADAYSDPGFYIQVPVLEFIFRTSYTEMYDMYEARLPGTLAELQQQ